MPEQTVQHAPDPTIEAMQAIRAIHPDAIVAVQLRRSGDGDDWASVTVSEMPVGTFPEEYDDGLYPNCSWAKGGFLSVSRYHDGDVGAALAKALELITSRAAVAS